MVIGTAVDGTAMAAARAVTAGQAGRRSEAWAAARAPDATTPDTFAPARSVLLAGSHRNGDRWWASLR